MENEIWKDIEGYEGLYQVSNLGRVKSLNHYNTNGKAIILYKGKILKPVINNNGYKRVYLAKNGKIKTFYVHRLVLKTFVENNNNYEIINHKDENKLNNRVDNLEWCTYKYNNNYGTKKDKISKKVKQIDYNGNLIKVWNSISEANKNYNTTNIGACCRKERKSAKGYKWEYYIME